MKPFYLEWLEEMALVTAEDKSNSAVFEVLADLYAP